MSRFDVNKEKELLTKAQQGDLQARRQLHIVYKGLLDSIVYPKYTYSPQPASAIRAEAEDLLDKCIDSWDPLATNKPSTYIKGYIDNKLKRYVNDNKQLVRVTETYAWKTDDFAKVLKELTSKLYRDPTDNELLIEMNKQYPKHNLTLKDIGRLRNEVRTTTLASTAIGSPSGDDSTMRVEDLAFTTTVDPMKQYALTLQAREINNKITKLSEPHKTVIKYHLGIDGFPQLSLRDISVKTGLNKYRIQKVIEETREILQ